MSDDDTAYVGGRTRSLVMVAAGLFTGWLVARILFTFLRAVTVGPIFLQPGFVVVVVCAATLPVLVRTDRRTDVGAAFIVGVLADSWIYWVLRAGTGGPFETRSAWDLPVLQGSFVGLVIAGLALTLFAIVARLRAPTRVGAIDHVGWLLWGLAGMATIAAFRIAHSTSRHLPNEERSLMIAGYEIHHAVTGAILLGLIAAGWAVGGLPRNRITAVVAGAGAGAVVDQSIYMSLIEVTDQAYDSVLSWCGLFGGAVFMAACVVSRFGRARR
jgi:hypothetical protein